MTELSQARILANKMYRKGLIKNTDIYDQTLKILEWSPEAVKSIENIIEQQLPRPIISERAKRYIIYAVYFALGTGTYYWFN